MTLLSIIVPVYNKEEFLDDCLNSILAQTVEGFQLILVNDGSTDSSGYICDSFRNLDSRITVIQQENKGVHAARNAGLAIAEGKYVGFVDSDDSLEPDMYALLLSNAMNYNADVSMCGVKRIFPHKKEVYGGRGTVKIYDRDEGISGLLNGSMLVSIYDKIYRRETIRDIQFKPAVFEDAYYNFEALMASKLSIYDDTLLYNYMIRDNSVSMASFNQSYMQGLMTTRKMLQVCEHELPEHVEEARAFDFNSNMMMLNMILIESRKRHIDDFNIIVKNLSRYNSTYKYMTGISTKYKYGYRLVNTSVALYEKILGLYGYLTNSEHLERKKKLI